MTYQMMPLPKYNITPTAPPGPVMNMCLLVYVAILIASFCLSVNAISEDLGPLDRRPAEAEIAWLGICLKGL
jgi:hypothetical protein